MSLSPNFGGWDREAGSGSLENIQRHMWKLLLNLSEHALTDFHAAFLLRGEVSRKPWQSLSMPTPFFGATAFTQSSALILKSAHLKKKSHLLPSPLSNKRIKPRLSCKCSELESQIFSNPKLQLNR